MRKQQGKITNDKLAKRYRRKLKIRSTINGTAERPRVCVTKSNKNLAVQVCDDSASKTLFSFSTFGKNKTADRTKEGAKKLGIEVAAKLKGQNVEAVVFDRNGFKYHGLIAEIADGIREGGIKL